MNARTCTPHRVPASRARDAQVHSAGCGKDRNEARTRRFSAVRKAWRSRQPTENSGKMCAEWSAQRKARALGPRPRGSCHSGASGTTEPVVPQGGSGHRRVMPPGRADRPCAGGSLARTPRARPDAGPMASASADRGQHACILAWGRYSAEGTGKAGPTAERGQSALLAAGQPVADRMV